MRRWWKSYLHFNSVESAGIMVMLLIIMVLIVVYLALPFFVQTKGVETDPALEAAFVRYQKHKGENSGAYADSFNTATAKLFSFDPNTLDSAGFRRLGLKAKTTHLLLNWRRKGKIFRKPEDLRPLYTLDDATYQRLAPFISIAAMQQKPEFSHFSLPSVPDHININTTDSQTLVRLRGIGPVLAHKILLRRQQLGGFLRYDQLLEVFRFDDTVYKMLQQKLFIDSSRVKKINLNTASLTELQMHPYIGEQMAKNILLLRDGLKRFDNIEQLRQVPLMNAEKYRKIAPYCSLE